MALSRAFESKWVRLGVSSLAASVLWYAAVWLAFWASWSYSGELIDGIFYALIYAVPGLVCGVVAWYSRTIWSIVLAILAALAMRDIIIPCEAEIHQTWACTPGTASIGSQLAVVLPIVFAWAAGYWLGRRAT